MICRDMDIEKYRAYARTPDAYAVLFVKKHLDRADGSVWVDILGYDAPPGYEPKRLEFKSVKCELFPRESKPVYPPRWMFRFEQCWIDACRAVMWGTATRDICDARRLGYHGPKYRIEGALARCKPDPRTFFVDAAPTEIKALAGDLSDRTDPLWDEAARWISPGANDKYEFKIRGIVRVG